MFNLGICGGAVGRRAWRSLGILGVLLLAVGAVLGLASTGAEANSKFAAITVDARNGKVLFSSSPDSIRHPASLTKMMTLYVVFQELESGRLSLNSPIRMSARAAGMAPSKLGVKPGQSITVETAIRALVVKSANDVAAAVAENIGGSEKDFARRMTRTARSLGMSRTTFANASGLPNPNQVTTARDMATLGLRLMRDFPQYYAYFRTRSFVYKGRTITGHNRLLASYEGTDGIKTGYINASGFNLVSSVRRGEKRLVGVVLGGRTGASRDTYMKQMLTKNFGKARNGNTIAAIAGSSRGAIAANEAGEVPAASGQKKDRKTAAAKRLKKTEEAIVQATPEPVEQGDTQEGLAELAAQASAADPNVEVVPPPSPVPDAEEGELVSGDASAKTPSEQLADKAQVASISPAPDASWFINLGDYATKNDAQAILQKLRQREPGLVAGKTAQTVMVEKAGTVTYRARFTGFDAATAASACKVIRKGKAPCQPQGPS
jgi:D-alanyl-D-alanine carboxypeptidase